MRASLRVLKEAVIAGSSGLAASGAGSTGTSGLSSSRLKGFVAGFTFAAGFSTDTNGGCAPVEVQFTDESSSNVEEWLWTFEGGNPATSTEQNPVVLYQNYGTFNVSLVVSNSAGESTLVQEDLITIDPQPEADFSFSVDGFTVDFTDASSFGDTYEWSFGDGQSSDEQNPTHSYEEDGTYEVTLKISNECGENTIVKTVTILTPPVPAFSRPSSSDESCPV